MRGGRERDGVFETEECVHFVEATTSRRMEKAQYDVDKLAGAVAEHNRKTTGKPAQGWFITGNEPTAEQRGTLHKKHNLIRALSFQQFQARLIDAGQYLAARGHYAFGSIADPVTGAPVTGAKETEIHYVPLDLVHRETGDRWNTKKICDDLVEGRSFTLLGDYGAGKSVTLRQIYRQLRLNYLRGRSAIFPVYVNLRDHSGQDDPTEVLERHARMIGFEKPSHLVRAWRSGYAVLLLDGFDEVAAFGIHGSWKDLRAQRERAVAAVRKIFRQAPEKTGSCVAGRAHFFDSDDERRASLGLSPGVIELDLNEFTEAQLAEYLAKSGLSAFVPQWMPSRPLLVGYIVSKGLLRTDEAADLAQLDPADGWINLLEKIARRESLIDAGIDGPTVRRILERLSTKARHRKDGMGPLSSDEIMAAFSEICGHPPDGQELVLLQRLPGLGVASTSDQSRSFIDEDFADVCRAGDVTAFARDPYSCERSMFAGAEKVLGSMGVSVSTRKLEGEPNSRITTAIQHAVGLNDWDALLADLARISKERSSPLTDRIYVRDILIDEFAMTSDDPDLSSLEFQSCYFRTIQLDPFSINVESLPTFRDCFISDIQGPTSEGELPSNFKADCYIEHFENQSKTTKTILDLDLPLGVRVLMTVLRKLYMQSGRGRLRHALIRGLDQRARELVPGVLGVLQQDGFVVSIKRGDNEILLPDRSKRLRASKIITEPTTCKDPLISKVTSI